MTARRRSDRRVVSAVIGITYLVAVTPRLVMAISVSHCSAEGTAQRAVHRLRHRDDVIRLLGEEGLNASAGSDDGPPQVVIDGTSDDRQQERDSRLWALFRELKRLRDEMLKAGESLRLGGTLDVDGDVATVRDIESEIRRADNRNVRR